MLISGDDVTGCSWNTGLVYWRDSQLAREISKEAPRRTCHAQRILLSAGESLDSLSDGQASDALEVVALDAELD